MWERIHGYVVSALLLGAVVYPLAAKGDSFPLSTFPMFSKARPDVAEIDHVVGIAANGGSRALPPEMVASREVLQAKVTVSLAVKRGKQAAAELCSAAAANVATESGWEWVERLEVRSDTYQVSGYFSGSKQPLRSAVHARCPVTREGVTR
jgi:hypothetical protein